MANLPPEATALYQSPAVDRVAPRVWSQRYQAAKTLAATIKGEFTNGRIQTWRQLEQYGIPLDRITGDGKPMEDKVKDMPIESAWQLSYILDNRYVPRFPFWAEEDLLKAEQEGQILMPKKKLRLTPETQCFRFPTGCALFPEQDPVVQSILDMWFPRDGSAPVQHVLCPGGTGAGKTVIAAAAVYRAIKEHNMHLPPAEFPIPLLYPIQWVSVTNAVEQTKREWEEKTGLADFLGRYVHIYGYSALGSSEKLGQLTEEVIIEPEEDPWASEEEVAEKKALRIIRWLQLSTPRVLVVDECHKLANEESGISRTFATLAEMKDKLPLGTRSLWLSATPFEKVADSKSFVCFAGVNYGGTRITPKNFYTMFAKDVAKGAPTVVTAASMERLYAAIKKHVVEIPYIPWPHKSINSTNIVEFENEESRNRVANAWEEHLERCARMGKKAGKGKGAIYASFTVFRNKVEHERMPQVVRMMHDAVENEGRSAVCGTAFVGAIKRGVFTLVDDYGVDPSQISIIWGGAANIKPEVFLTKDQMFALVQKDIEELGKLSPANKRLIQQNLAWEQDGIIYGDADDPDRQLVRYARMQRLGLTGIQTKERRQAEIDKMQSGKALYCFFTMASGGTGLSLPHCDARQRPRSGWYTPIYSGKEFTQAFGRLPRRNSISDSYQQVVLLRGTIESEHVAPILDNKLKSAAAFTSKKTDLISTLAALFMEKQAEFESKRNFGTALVRTVEQAVNDAYNDEGTQVHFSSTVEDDDDEE